GRNSRIGAAQVLARLRPPDGGAGALVEGDEAVAAARLVAPAGVNHAHDDQVAVHDRAVDPAAIAGDSPVFLSERPRPDDLAILVEAEEESLHAVAIDVARLRVARHRRPAQARADDVREEDVELVLPDELTGLGVEADDALLLGQPLADVVHK